METPEVMIMWGAVIKIIIDIFKWLIPEKVKMFIPVLAIAIGLTWAYFFMDGELFQQIYIGIVTGAAAVGIHETSTIGKE